jgi:hypothetical protein
MGRGVLFDFCIYTIAHPDKVAKAHHRCGSTKFSEKKVWRTGAQLLTEAKTRGAVMPVVFGDATYCKTLLSWGILKRIVIDDKTTHYFVEQVRPIKGSHSHQDLVLRSTGKHIKPNFRRPYAICLRPSFLPKRHSD